MRKAKRIKEDKGEKPSKPSAETELLKKNGIILAGDEEKLLNLIVEVIVKIILREVL